LLTEHLSRVQRAVGIGGATLEIGVFQGKYLAALYALSQAGEAVVGVDLFVGSQDTRADARRVHANIVAACGSDERLKIVVADSMTLTSGRLREETGGADLRFLSIDGGHTRELVLHDLEASAGLLAPGGIIALDDAFSSTTPGVTEGIMQFFLERRPQLAPFATCYNKLFVTTPDFHPRYLREALVFLERTRWLPTHERTLQRRRENDASGFTPFLFGYEVVAFL
jgi:predicted O-methyltransferase YrrM